MSTDSGKLRILLVDDSDDDRFLFTVAFQRSEVSGEIIEKEDGDEAIDFLGQVTSSDHSELPNAVFLDLKMPGLNGFEVLEWLRERPLFKDLQVFVLSGSHEPSDIQRAKDLGAIDYIVKPIKPMQIQQLLSPLQRQRQQ